MATRYVESITVTTDGTPSWRAPAYKIGDYIEFRVVFSEAVGCTEPDNEKYHELKFEMGVGDDGVRTEAGFYDSFTLPTEGRLSKSVFDFRYTVEEGDSDSDGIHIPRGDSALRGQEYHEGRDLFGNCADPFTRQRASSSNWLGHRIDGVRPVLESAEGLRDKVTLTFSEDLDDGDDGDAPGPPIFSRSVKVERVAARRRRP